jgi:hypothetical protein
MAKGYSANAKEVISKAANVPMELHAHMFLKEQTPKMLEVLAEFFRAEPSPLVEYSHAQTVVGS